MGARFYKPAPAMFTSRDTYDGVLGSPLSLNRYTYAEGDPIQNADPTGHNAMPATNYYDYTPAQIKAFTGMVFADTINKGRAAHPNAPNQAVFVVAMGLTWIAIEAWRQTSAWAKTSSARAKAPAPTGPSVAARPERPCDDDFRLNGRCVFPGDVPIRPQGLRHLYTVEFPLGEGTSVDAERLVRRIMTNPNDYFPFTVRRARCGDRCDPPLSSGNVLSLKSSTLLGDPGHVVVISAGRTGWAFVASDDHIAAGGVVEFVIKATGGTDSTFSLKVIAWGAERGLEGRSPGSVASFFGQLTWSMFAAAIRCEQIYEGQEQYRRC